MATREERQSQLIKRLQSEVDQNKQRAIHFAALLYDMKHPDKPDPNNAELKAEIEILRGQLEYEKSQHDKTKRKVSELARDLKKAQEKES